MLSSRTGSISIPVFLSDSLKVPEKKMDIAHAVVSYEYNALNKKFNFPMNIANDMQKMDQVIESLKIHGIEYETIIDKLRESKINNDKGTDVAYNNLISSFKKSISHVVSEKEMPIIEHNMKTLFDLINEESNSIWTYVLRNMYKPIVMSHKKIDLLIGNPPWLGLNNMKNEEYQNYLRERSKYYLFVDKKKSQNISNLNLATLFFCQCVEQYLKDKGQIAFVMPQGVLFASQHVNFLKFEKIPLKLTQIYDLENVTPLFRILSCVLFATKGNKTNYPVTSYLVEGKLPSSNSSLNEAKSILKFKKTKYSPVDRTSKHSYYYDMVSQGAQIIPRCFWFVDIQSDSFLGFNPQNPLVKSAVNRDSKHPWNKIMLEGNVEKQFFTTSLLSKDIVPFGYLKRRPLIVPLLMKNNEVKLITDSKQNEIVGSSFSKYLVKAEKLWDENATAKSKKNMTIYDRIDYQKDLSSQTPKGGYTVLYVKSATYLASCVVNNDEKYSIDVGNTKFEIKGFFAEGTTYFYKTESEEEAFYLCSIFNSKILDDKIKPLQSRGAFGGARDIHKLPVSFDIPKYDPKNKVHKELVETGLKCSKKIKEILPTLSIKSSGVLRRKIRELLKNEFSIIDKNTSIILK